MFVCVGVPHDHYYYYLFKRRLRQPTYVLNEVESQGRDDACGECAMPGGNATVVGLPTQNSGTIMVSLIWNDRSNTCDF